MTTMKILHSNSEYAAISSIGELRRARRKLRLRIARSENGIELRSHRLLSFDSVVSSVVSRIAFVKQSVAGIVDGYTAIRDYIRSCRERRDGATGSDSARSIEPTASGSEAE